MIDFAELLPAERVVIESSVPTRKVALRTLARLLATGCNGVSYRDIYFGLEDRESQASTVLDEAPVAIPHCRSPECTKAVAALMLIEDKEGMIFGEDQVRLFFSLYVPASEHSLALKVLQAVVQLIADKEILQQLLAQESAQALHELFQRSLKLETSS